MSSIDNQYLRPEEPLITDAKKSPLALLAMTCSNIGADVLGNSKPTYEKTNNKRSKSQESAESDKINANSTDSNHSPASNHSHSDTNHVVHHHQRSPIPTSNGKSSGQISFKPYEDVSSKKSVMSTSDQVKCVKSMRERCSPSRSSSSSSTTKRSPSETPSMNRSSSSSTITTATSSSSTSNATKSNEPHVSTASYNPLESDLLKSSGHLTAAYASLMSQQLMSQQLKSSQQVCRDPSCTGCQMSSPFSAPGHCCNGLSACIHQNPFASYASALRLAGHPFSSHLAAASRYQNGLSSGLGRPYVCNWTGGGTYCGKNFSTSEELLQHLKSHTSSSSYASGSSNPMSGHSSMSGFGQYPHHLDPMLTSPVAGLRRAAFDPVNRFHPYKPFGLPLTQLGSTFNPSLSSLPPHLHHSAAAAAAAAANAGLPWRDSLR